MLERQRSTIGQDLGITLISSRMCVCVSLCLYSNPVSVLTRLPSMVDFIKPQRPHRSTDLTLVLLLYELFSQWCFHHSGLSTAVDFSIIKCTIPLFLRRAAGQNHYFYSFSSLIEKLKVITYNVYRFSLLLTDTTQELVNLYPLHESCVCCSRHPGDGSSSLENPVLNSK